MRKKTHEEFVYNVSVNNSCIDVVGQYVNSRIKIMCRCKTCGYEWSAFPDNILKGHGCPSCANDKRSKAHVLTTSEYANRLSLVNSSIELVGNYKNQNIKTAHRCKICGNEWMAYPNNVLAGKGCKKCFDKQNAINLKKSHDIYVEQVENINNNIVVLEEYINARTPIKHKCKICGGEWDVSPDNILRGHGCPVCIESNGEKTIKEYLISRSIEFEQQYAFSGCKNKKLLRFDFYIPTLNACIEYDGIQHFESIEYFGGSDAFKKRQHNDIIKNNYCLSHKIILLRIRYDQDVEEELNKFFNNTKLIKEVS